MAELTKEQLAAVESRGKVIVSASAGSGKTFVMIKKLTEAIENGADLEGVLAVTFTREAAAQMKEKLRTSLVNALDTAEGKKRAHIKEQLSKIPSADISTIHSFCSRLLRTYFYVLGIDGGFEIISSDDAIAKDMKERALDNIFEAKYESDDPEFLHLLKCYRRKRSDGALRGLVLEYHNKVRSVARYRQKLENAHKLYTAEGFERVCGELSSHFAAKYTALYEMVEEFESSFPLTKNAQAYAKIFAEMKNSLTVCAEGGVFAPAIPLVVTTKPHDGEADKAAGELYSKFRASIVKKYAAVRKDIADEQTELQRFLESGRTAVAFANLVLEFDAEYSTIKNDENKLDYNDLEHLTLQLLEDEGVRAEINSKYHHVFVDEYQDVNPVQEEIISSLGGEVFLVGDVKQAIYGFRGSKSLFFAEKYNRFEGGGGTALRLSGNFRSCKNVLTFVNFLFGDVMHDKVCGFNYKNNAEMVAAGNYPEDCGYAKIELFGKDERKKVERGVYSVLEDNCDTSHSREGLAVLRIVEEELKSRHYDLSKGCYVDTQPGDICILVRKSKHESTEAIIRAVKERYPVSGAQEENICALPEVKSMLDILSLIDNAEQDVPLVTTMLSPLGGFLEDELAAIRIFCVREKRISFRKCCEIYIERGRGYLAEKLNQFFVKLNTYRNLAEILTAGELIDCILEDSGLEAEYSLGSGEKLKNVIKLSQEGYNLTLAAFLEKIKAGGYKVSAPASAPSDSIKIMTMHSAKGLEFPVVIIADICRTYKGQEREEIFYDEDYGFAPKLYDAENMLVYPTLLRKLVKLRADREELKNELNLFYVACTRAKCKLHVLMEEVKEFSAYDSLEAKSYAQTFNAAKFAPKPIEPHEEIQKLSQEVTVIYQADEESFAQVDNRFMREYSHAESVDLPVKSSASAILKSLHDDEPYYRERELFPPESQTGTERGTAYHRFLELCDFSIKTHNGVKKQLEKFLLDGLMTEDSAALLSVDELVEILNMPVFDDVQTFTLFREREFLCRLKACDVMPTSAQDYVLLQGAIDLLCVKDGQIKIIDYKYSKKNETELINTYSAQLALYKKAVSAIMHVDEERISTAIVNIFHRTQILLN